MTDEIRQRLRRIRKLAAVVYELAVELEETLDGLDELAGELEQTLADELPDTGSTDRANNQSN